MAHLIESTFSAYSLALEEELAGMSLTSNQKMFIQNEICKISESILALVPDPNNYSKFIQDNAFLSGQVAALKLLIDYSVAAQQQLLELAKQC